MGREQYFKNETINQITAHNSDNQISNMGYGQKRVSIPTEKAAALAAANGPTPANSKTGLVPAEGSMSFSTRDGAEEWDKLTDDMDDMGQDAAVLTAAVLCKQESYYKQFKPNSLRGAIAKYKKQLGLRIAKGSGRK